MPSSEADIGAQGGALVYDAAVYDVVTIASRRRRRREHYALLACCSVDAALSVLGRIRAAIGQLKMFR
jgi:hypothetical protein